MGFVFVADDFLGFHYPSFIVFEDLLQQTSNKCYGGYKGLKEQERLFLFLYLAVCVSDNITCFKFKSHFFFFQKSEKTSWGSSNIYALWGWGGCCCCWVWSMLLDNHNVESHLFYIAQLSGSKNYLETSQLQVSGL